jgi:hypothetical protein
MQIKLDQKLTPGDVVPVTDENNNLKYYIKIVSYTGRDVVDGKYWYSVEKIFKDQIYDMS